MSIKVNVGDYEIVLSQSFVITRDNNNISLTADDESGGFKLRLHFDTKVSKDAHGKVGARADSEINDGLTLKLFNLFSSEDTSNAKDFTRFFRKRIRNEDGELMYFKAFFFAFSSQSLSDKNDAILFNLTIATKPEELSGDSEG